METDLDTDEYRDLFRYIGDYTLTDRENKSLIFQSLTSFVKDDQPINNIIELLRILMLIMYCSDISRKHFIIFDNIESYIKLDSNDIQIIDKSIEDIVCAITDAHDGIINDFEGLGIEPDLGWKAFKVIIVLRRTSIGLLFPGVLHCPDKDNIRVMDLTGCFQIYEIYDKKKTRLWHKICNKYNDSDIIDEILSEVMNDRPNPERPGQSYQSLISPLMSWGIRRNAKAQAHAVFKTKEALSDKEEYTINHEVFKQLLNNSKSQEGVGIRYMFRRALLEFQLKWFVCDDNYVESSNRWKALGLGHVIAEYRSGGITTAMMECDREFNVWHHCFDYYDKNNYSLVRRILSFLSFFRDDSNHVREINDKPVVEMYSTVSFYDMINGIVIRPNGQKKKLTKKDLLPFARVLIALADMRNRDNKGAPFVVLNIKDYDFHVKYKASEGALASIMLKIWNAGENESSEGNQYNSLQYGARLTDAGSAFLLNWQPSFSFMEALYCNNSFPLFFLKDKARIKSIIKRVYTSANYICEQYETEAKAFCGRNFTLDNRNIRPIINNREISFRERVKLLHIDYLREYRQYIESSYKVLGFDDDDRTDVSEFIHKYINSYQKWNTGEGAPLCF